MIQHVCEPYDDLDDLWRHLVDVHDWDLDGSWNKIPAGDAFACLNELHCEAHADMEMANG